MHLLDLCVYWFKNQFSGCYIWLYIFYILCVSPASPPVLHLKFFFSFDVENTFISDSILSPPLNWNHKKSLLSSHRVPMRWKNTWTKSQVYIASMNEKKSTHILCLRTTKQNQNKSKAKNKFSFSKLGQSLDRNYKPSVQNKFKTLSSHFIRIARQHQQQQQKKQEQNISLSKFEIPKIIISWLICIYIYIFSSS